MNNIKKLRIDSPHKPKQNEVANYLGISRTLYNKYENGVTNPPVSVLVKIADYYHVTVDYLIGRNNIKTEEPEPNVPANQQLVIKLLSKLNDEQLIKVSGYILGLLDA